MPQTKKPEREEKDELEELNQWPADLTLKNGIRARVMRDNHYTVQWDEQGQPIQVVEVAR